MREEVKKFIDEELVEPYLTCPISSVEGNMLMNEFTKRMKRELKLEGELELDELFYLQEKFWKLHRYSNWSGD